MFHGAATVRLDEHIREAININVLGTIEVVKLAKEVTNLKVRSEIDLLKIHIYTCTMYILVCFLTTE